jgi:hypothetical protein
MPKNPLSIDALTRSPMNNTLARQVRLKKRTQPRATPSTTVHSPLSHRAKPEYEYRGLLSIMSQECASAFRPALEIKPHGAAFTDCPLAPRGATYLVLRYSPAAHATAFSFHGRALSSPALHRSASSRTRAPSQSNASQRGLTREAGTFAACSSASALLRSQPSRSATSRVVTVPSSAPSKNP